jgi:thioredoxin-related protein
MNSMWLSTKYLNAIFIVIGSTIGLNYGVYQQDLAKRITIYGDSRCTKNDSITQLSIKNSKLLDNSKIDSNEKPSIVVSKVFDEIIYDSINYNNITVGKGIEFQIGLNWSRLEKKAKKENKFLFVDCYATWCGPCKEMDLKVYPIDKIGEYMNKNFISVKLQMDTSEKDNESVKTLYPTASKFLKQYAISVLPTYLFFSPDGELVHKGLGELNVSEFIKLATQAKDSNQQIFTMLKRARLNKLNYNLLPGLVSKMKEIQENKAALEVARYYMEGYLDKLSEDEFLKKENLEFMNFNKKIIKSSDRLFKYCYVHPNTIDKIIGQSGYARQMVNYVIKNEEIIPLVENANSHNLIPEWEYLFNIIKLKYDIVYAKENIVDMKVAWYESKEDWINYTKYLVEQMDRTFENNKSWLSLNSSAWTVFTYSFNNAELEKALLWVNKSIILLQDESKIPGVMDTKANILYKLGKIDEAIAVYEAIVKLKPSMFVTLEKIKQGIPTWPQKK